MRNFNFFSPSAGAGPRRSTGMRAAAEDYAFSQGLSPGGPGWGDAIRTFVADRSLGNARAGGLLGQADETSFLQQRRFEPNPGDAAPQRSMGPREDREENETIGREWDAIIANEGGVDENGRFLTSPDGAVGPAQVLPTTGPEAARLAGLPWDERRFRTDHAYNVALGRAYYEHQRRRFRDPDQAAAAYNAGPGATRQAIRRAERAGEPGNWLRYLPAETQDYVRSFREQTRR